MSESHAVLAGSHVVAYRVSWSCSSGSSSLLIEASSRSDARLDAPKFGKQVGIEVGVGNRATKTTAARANGSSRRALGWRWFWLVRVVEEGLLQQQAQNVVSNHIQKWQLYIHNGQLRLSG
jgi:hypothetical protein